mgnify:CR=1 FL=1
MSNGRRLSSHDIDPALMGKAREQAAAKKAKMAEPIKLAVGDVLRSSWGYDQSNIDYYEVVALKGKRGDVAPLVEVSISRHMWRINGQMLMGLQSPKATERIRLERERVQAEKWTAESLARGIRDALRWAGEAAGEAQDASGEMAIANKGK